MAARNGKTAAVEQVETRTITIPRPELVRLNVPIVGTAALICNQFSEDAKSALREKFEGAQINPNRSKKRNPQREFEQASYRLEEDGYGFPAGAIKDAMGDSVLVLKETMRDLGYTKVFIKRVVRIPTRLLRLELEGEPEMVEDTIVNQMKGAVLVYRPYFWPWRAVVPIEFNKALIPYDHVLTILEYAGYHIGIGNWRPDRGGDYGTFTLDREHITLQE